MLCRLRVGIEKKLELYCVIIIQVRIPTILPCLLTDSDLTVFVRIRPSYICLCSDADIVLVLLLCTEDRAYFSALPLLWNSCDTSIYSFDYAFWISWVLLKLWNRMFMKRFEKMCVLIFLSWFEMCKNYIVGITNLWNNFGFDDCFI